MVPAIPRRWRQGACEGAVHVGGGAGLVERGGGERLRGRAQRSPSGRGFVGGESSLTRGCWGARAAKIRE
jgi:hypothetical protein